MKRWRRREPETAARPTAERLEDVAERLEAVTAELEQKLAEMRAERETGTDG